MSDIDYNTPALDVDDLDRVSWHMRSVRAAEDEMHDVERMANIELNRITEWRDARRRVLQNRIDWHSAPIRSYHEMRMTDDDSQRTIDTPHGRSKISVPVKPQVFIDDPDILTEWARTARPDLLYSRVNVTDLRKMMKVDDDGKVIDPSTGEVVPAVHAEVPAPRWSLDVDPGSPL